MSQERDNAVQEYFLRAFVALRLYEEFQFPIRLERLYTKIAEGAGVVPNWDLTNQIGGWKADIALDQSGLPPALIELKIFDEPRPAAAIEEDVRKLRSLRKIT